MKIKTKRGARRIRNQRVITRRFVTTDYTGNEVIKAGKLYIYQGGLRYGNIVTENGIDAFIILDKRLHCAFLHGKGEWRYATI